MDFEFWNDLKGMDEKGNNWRIKGKGRRDERMKGKKAKSGT